MKPEGIHRTILLAEDDPDDIYLISEALDECQLNARLFVVQDGEELVDYLLQRGPYALTDSSPRPDLILLDLNMPRMDGREALEVIKGEPELRAIPVVVLTTSSAKEDKESTYSLGSSGFVTKPVSFNDLRDTICNIGTYWLRTVDLPNESDQEDAE